MAFVLRLHQHRIGPLDRAISIGLRLIAASEPLAGPATMARRPHREPHTRAAAVLIWSHLHASGRTYLRRNLRTHGELSGFGRLLRRRRLMEHKPLAQLQALADVQPAERPLIMPRAHRLKRWIELLKE